MLCVHGSRSPLPREAHVAITSDRVRVVDRDLQRQRSQPSAASPSIKPEVQAVA